MPISYWVSQLRTIGDSLSRSVQSLTLRFEMSYLS